MTRRPIRDRRLRPVPPRRDVAARIGKRRAGLAPIELIIVLPIAFLFLLVIIQLGILLGNWQHVKEATFAGARAAADLSEGQLDDGELIDGTHTAQDVIKDRVDRTLAAAGLPPAGAIRIEFVPPSSDPANPIPEEDRFGAVRVVVTMDTALLAPNFLGFFGVSLVERRARSEIVCPHLGDAT